MYSTYLLLVFVGFFLWYNTSKKARWKDKSQFLLNLEAKPQLSKVIVTLCFLMATALLILELGWMSGICASIVAIMTMGSLIVAVFPFRYLNSWSLLLFYGLFLGLEIFI
jgi:hypothetical protein